MTTVRLQAAEQASATVAQGAKGPQWAADGDARPSTMAVRLGMRQQRQQHSGPQTAAQAR